MSKVKLGDVVERVKEFVDKDNTDLTFYIGGEHFESRSLTIKNRGYINGSTIGPAFHHRFRKGDVLLMSRNPHLRKAGMVDFDGICSDVSYVIRTKDENVIMQKFIPLLFQCDAFWEFAEKNKKGSTNFFLNWSDFEKFEFDLPAIEKQKKIVDVLWSIDNTIDTYNNVIKASDELVKSQFIEMFGSVENNIYGWDVREWKDVLNIRNGRSQKGVNDPNGMYPIYGSGGKMGMSKEYLSEENTIILGRKGTIDKPFISSEKCWIVDTSFGLEVDKKIMHYRFFYEWCKGFDFKGLNRAAVLPSLTKGDLLKIKIICPPIESQMKFVSITSQIDKSKFEIEKALNELKNLYQMIIKQGIC